MRSTFIGLYFIDHKLYSCANILADGFLFTQLPLYDLLDNSLNIIFYAYFGHNNVGCKLYCILHLLHIIQLITFSRLAQQNYEVSLINMPHNL